MQKEDKQLTIIFIIAIVVLLIIFIVYGYSNAVEFIILFSAGFLGILVSLTLNETQQKKKDSEIARDFLNLIHKELTEIKNDVDTQKSDVFIVYTYIWDSMVSSGLLRLLTSDQVSKLSVLYKEIKGASYEAEWVKRAYEGLKYAPMQTNEVLNALPIAEKNVDENRSRVRNLGTKIDSVLNEKWWGEQKPSPTNTGTNTS